MVTKLANAGLIVLLLSACGGAAKTADPVGQSTVVPVTPASSAAKADPAPGASAAPVASAEPSAKASAPAPVDESTMPKWTDAKLTACPAVIGSASLEARHGFAGRVDVFGCPGGESSPKHGAKAASRIDLLDAQGKKKDSLVLKEDGDITVSVLNLRGDGHPVLAVSVSPAGCAGSSCGPQTKFVEIVDGHLKNVRVANAAGKQEDIVVTSSLRRSWWPAPARSGSGYDIYEVNSANDGDARGTRYAFENGRWTAHEGKLAKKWTGEHLPDTNAQFP